jgi:hypothetical protein
MTFGIATMLIGVPKEIKDSEYRVGLVPSTVRMTITARSGRKSSRMPIRCSGAAS